ncbi:MAG: Na(+)-translocating NADH-quinone reductase subunit A [Cyclobacteriaceae bacterium]|nr:Na(+)-translocating NADH-quinone reductase subunit A [Cyclobacteriaceae bacterium]
MSKHIKLKKGFDIKLAGEAEKIIGKCEQPGTFAIKPSSFHGIQRPKLLVKEGDRVKAGTPVLVDKKNDRIKHVAPVSGEIAEVVRGEKRKILEVLVIADEKQDYEDYGSHSISEIVKLSQEETREKMLEAGVWPTLVERPFGVIANPEETPKTIVISAFDTHPLAPDADLLYKGKDQYFQAGIEVLKKFTTGVIHLNIDGKSEVSHIFAHAKDVQLNKFFGPHPAGNPGVQIHHLAPICKGDIVWTIRPQGVIEIGKLFLEGRYDTSRLVALTGPEVEHPQYYQTYAGACINKFTKDNLKSDHVRFISGNVLTGRKIDEDGHLGYFDQQITVVKEGDQFVPFGWVLPTLSKPSIHKALGLLAFLFPNKKFSVNTNTYGEPRAFVQTGVFEKVVPMDILPMYLIKAILAEDFDDMEGLGIYEVIEEDLALCEFVDVSKSDIQEILREGLDLIQYS